MNSFIMQIVSKYFYSERDFINLFRVNKKFEHVGEMYHYNPIALKTFDDIKLLFPNTQTYKIYAKNEEYIPNDLKISELNTVKLKIIKEPSREATILHDSPLQYGFAFIMNQCLEEIHENINFNKLVEYIMEDDSVPDDCECISDLIDFDKSFDENVMSLTVLLIYCAFSTSIDNYDTNVDFTKEYNNLDIMNNEDFTTLILPWYEKGIELMNKIDNFDKIYHEQIMKHIEYYTELEQYISNTNISRRGMLMPIIEYYIDENIVEDDDEMENFAYNSYSQFHYKIIIMNQESKQIKLINGVVPRDEPVCEYICKKEFNFEGPSSYYSFEEIETFINNRVNFNKYTSNEFQNVVLNKGVYIDKYARLFDYDFSMSEIKTLNSGLKYN